MVIIPLNLDEEIIEKIDLLVNQRRYKNRSEALRDQIISSLFKLSLIDDPQISSEDYQDIIDSLLKLETPPQLLNTEKTLTQLVSESRER